MSSNEPLEYEALLEDLKAVLSPEAAHKMERLIHTHIGGPMTTAFTQMEITEIIAQRKPEQLGEELTSLKENIRFASMNIRTIVKALAGVEKGDTAEEEDADEA